MTPLRLLLSGFGPFAGDVSIDFREMSEMGLYVIAGPTGAGKSSIFDGITYALFGKVAGTRAERDLISHFKDATVETRVELDFETSAGQFRVCRQPQQIRAKKRGDGTMVASANVELYEMSHGHPKAIESGARNVNARCEQLLGLTFEHFCSVVLLPQGKLEALLIATGGERRELLRQLFDTDLYQKVEDVFRERAKLASQSLNEAHADFKRQQQEIASTMLEFVSKQTEVEQKDELSDIVGVEMEGHLNSLTEIIDNDDVRTDDISFPELFEKLCQPILDRSALLLRNALDAEDQTKQARDAAKRDVENFDEFCAGWNALVEIDARSDEHDARRKTHSDAVAAAPLADQAKRLQRVQQERDALYEAALRTYQSIMSTNSLLATRIALDVDGLPQNKNLANESGNSGATLQCASEILDVARPIANAAVLAIDSARQIVTNHQLFERAESAVQKCVAELAALDVRITALQHDKEEKDKHINDRKAERKMLATAAADTDQAAVELRSVERVLTHRTLVEQLNQQLQQGSRAIEKLEADIEQCERVRSTTTHEIEAIQKKRAQLEPTAVSKDVFNEFDAEIDQFTSAQSATIAARNASGAAIVAVESAMNDLQGATISSLQQALVNGEACLVCGSTEHDPEALQTTHDSNTHVNYADIEQLQQRSRTAQHNTSEAELLERTIGDRIETTYGFELGALRLATARDFDQKRDELAAVQQRIHELTVRNDELVATVGELDRSLEASRTTLAKTLGGQTSTTRQLAELEREPPVVSASITARGAAEEITDQELREMEAALNERVKQGSDARTRQLNVESALDDLVTELPQMVADISTAKQQHKTVTSAQVHAIAERDALAETLVTEEVHQLHRSLLDKKDNVNEAIQELVEQRTLRDELLRRLTTAEQELTADVSRSIFQSTNDALRCSLSEAERDELQTRITAHDQKRSEASLVLARFATIKVPSTRPELDGFVAQVAKAQQLVAARDKNDRANAQYGAKYCDQMERLEALAQDIGNTQRENEEILELNAIFNPSQKRRSSLEVWVLAHHIRAVTTRANEHLGRMSNGQFQLRSQGDDGFAETADATPTQSSTGTVGNLDLFIDDTRSGTRRSTKTLSGGEKFEAALSLALGLADTVAANKSGHATDVLFVDEGFGSLDSASLDRAINTLEGLRRAGLTVGIITHVEEMKQRLPIGIEVRPRPDQLGSDVCNPQTVRADTVP